MNYHHEQWAAKGRHHGDRGRHLSTRSMERAAVNIYKTDNSLEMLVFAPGRVKENFHLEIKGTKLLITYTPAEGFPRPEWVHREYSRGGFVRTFELDEVVDLALIQAKYVDGVLHVSLPLAPGKERVSHEIPVN